MSLALSILVLAPLPFPLGVFSPPFKYQLWLLELPSLEEEIQL